LELKLENLSKTWRGFRLKNINLTVEEGEYFILLGPTGAGKTLLLETIMGFQRPDSGKITVGGQDVTAVVPEKRKIGYVSQNCLLFPHLDVRQNIEFGLKMRGDEKSGRKKIVDSTLESTRLKHLEHRRPATLSGGEKQKVALARVLAVEPDVILLDESLSALDAQAARDLRGELKRIHKNGKAVIHVTHNQVEGFSLGDKMAIMRSGEIVQTGKTREVFAEPNSEFTARFLGYENVFKATAVEEYADYSAVDVGGVKLKAAGKAGADACFVAVRPEDVTVQLSPVKEGAGLNVLEGTIVDCVDQGQTVALTCEGSLRLQAVLIKSAFLEENFEEGQKVWLAFKSKAVHIIR
jgi:ABC-type Fe3+/spermidine/putrescine transport system ATPase subunit